MVYFYTENLLHSSGIMQKIIFKSVQTAVSLGLKAFLLKKNQKKLCFTIKGKQIEMCSKSFNFLKITLKWKEPTTKSSLRDSHT